MSLTSLELNYLIWRYLQESGYELAAFALQKKSQCLEYEHEKNKLIDSILPGCLPNLVQKGILYTFVEDAAEGKEEKLTLVNAIIKEHEQKLALQNNTHISPLKPQANGVKPAEDVEMEDAESVKQENSTGDAENSELLPFKTAVLAPSLHFSHSVAAQWHPLSDVFAFGREDALAIIHALGSHGVAETVTLNHPPVLMDENSVENEISTVLWSPLGSTVLTSGIDGEIRAWTPDGRLKNIVNSTTNTERVPSLLQLLIWNFRGLLLLTIDTNNTVCVWDGNTLAPISEARTLDPFNGVLAACWVSDTKFAILTAKNGIKIYSVNPQAPFESSALVVGQLVGHANTISAITFSPVSKLLASSSDTDYAIKVWNSSSSQDALELNVISENEPHTHYHTTPILLLSWLTRVGDVQGNELLSVSMEGAVNVWDAFSGEPLVSSRIFSNPNNFHFDDEIDIDQKKSLVFAASISPDSKFLAVGDDLGNVSIWDVQVLHYRGTKDVLRCLGVYAVGKREDVGICDIVWDSSGKHICVCYKGVDSIVLDLLELAKV